MFGSWFRTLAVIHVSDSCLDRFLQINQIPTSEGLVFRKKEKNQQQQQDLYRLRALFALHTRGGIVQLVECRTETLGAILSQVRFPWAGRNVSFSLCKLSVQIISVYVQPPCAIACISICAHVTNPKHWQPYHREPVWPSGKALRPWRMFVREPSWKYSANLVGS